MMTIGSAIRFIRTIRGMKQYELAERGKLSTSFMSAIERDVNVPTLLDLRKICFVLGVRTSTVFLLTEETDLNNSPLNSHILGDILEDKKEQLIYYPRVTITKE